MCSVFVCVVLCVVLQTSLNAQMTHLWISWLIRQETLYPVLIFTKYPWSISQYYSYLSSPSPVDYNSPVVYKDMVSGLPYMVM